MSETNQIREKAVAITTRISGDAAFKAQVLSNPEATLLAAGMPAEAIPEFLAEQQAGETRGYGCTFTCVITECSLSLLED